MQKRLALIAIIITLALTALAQVKGVGTYYVSGMVRDSVTFEPVPFASVATPGNAVGVLTDEHGIFELTVPANTTQLQVACLGYDKKMVPVSKGYVNLYDVRLAPIATQLREVVVRKQKYSKKNNPAVDFAKRIKTQGPLTDPRRLPYYNYSKHELFTLALNDFAKDENSWMFKKFPFLWEHVDTSEISGKPILNVMVKERSAQVHYRHDPESEKEVVTGVRQEGVDEIVDQASMLTFMDDVLREIDLYDKDINILQNRFVSPLSPIAPDFYRFYLADTVNVDGVQCAALSFYPRNQAAFGFNGQLFVPLNDSTMFVKKVTMRTPRGINLNFIRNLYITQEFDRAPDGTRLKKADDMTIEIALTSGMSGLYARRSVAYADHDFSAPADAGAIFAELGSQITQQGATERNEEFWHNARLLNVTDNEKHMADIMERLRQVPVFYWTEKFLKIMFTGYVNTGKPSKFDYGPVNTSISHNSLEGWRFRVGGMTTANLSKRWFGRGYLAYGLADRKLKYKAELEYSFLDKDYHSREFPVHALRLTSMYDIDQIGQHYLFTNPDNIFLSLKRLSDANISYLRTNKLEYILELRNNFSLTATIANQIQESSRLLQFRDGYGQPLRSYMETPLTLELRYAPGEKFYQTKTYRIPINLDAPVFVLSHTIAPKGWLGSKYAINKTEASMQKRFWFSAFGFTDIVLKGGHVWSRSPYPNLLIPNANLSYTIQPESFALMNPMEFVNDTYAIWDVTYWANGAILNYIPLIKKLKLREAFAFRGVWGHLSRRNDPALNPDLLQLPAGAGSCRLGNTPYMEASVGLDNIFKCLRVDYVWRLNYLNVPYKIDRSGLRIALHMTF